MLRVANEIIGDTLLAKDGEIGRCHDFLFDDRSWVVRYMVAKTAKWLPGRKVIISPVFLDQPDWENRQLPINQTREQIRQSPPLEDNAPVSLQYEINYHQYYSLPFYWIGHELWGNYRDPAGVIHPVPDQPAPEPEEIEEEEGHQRSVEEVTGYHIAAIDGDVGHVEGFLIDDITWALRYLVVNTRNWLPGRKVLIAPQWIESIDWVDEKVYIDLDTDKIENSPEFDPSLPVNRQYEIKLYNYFEKPYYWKER